MRGKINIIEKIEVIMNICDEGEIYNLTVDPDK